jgi:CheY-like chemotaxis protein
MTNIKKVLIAEDEKPLAMALEIKLKKVGIDAKAVFDGAEALNELQTNKYSLILLDLMMPVMDGWTVLNEINSKKLAVKVIVTSNLSQPEDIQKA